MTTLKDLNKKQIYRYFTWIHLPTGTRKKLRPVQPKYTVRCNNIGPMKAIQERRNTWKLTYDLL